MKFEGIKHIFENEQSCVDYLIQQEIFKPRIKCTRCRCFVYLNKEKGVYRCKKQCRKEKSIYNNGIFNNMKIQIHTFMHLAYLYLYGMPLNSIKEILGLAGSTVTRQCRKIRKYCSYGIAESSMRIGGSGIVIEVDETKLGKRKYNKGHRVEGVWILVGVERTPEKRMFAFEVENRSTQTILSIFEKFVEKGSIVHTDGWKAYPPVCEILELEHLVVNHKKTFKDKITGACTNTVEGLNNGIKLAIPHKNRTKKHLKHHLNYFIWKRQNKKQRWVSFIETIKKINN